MSRLEIIVSVLKFAAIFLSALFGTFALITDYRNKETGEITKWGKRALFGVIASAVVLAAILVGELLQQANERAHTNQSALDHLQRQEKILSQINRGLNPLSNVRASFVFAGLRLEDPLLSSYVTRVRKQSAAMAAIWKRNPRFEIPGTVPVWKGPLRSGSQNIVDSVHIRRDSPLFPSKQREPAAFILLNAIDSNDSITISFFRKPIEFTDYPIYEPVDVTMSFREDREDSELFELTCDFREDTFTISTGKLITDSRDWDSTGKIASFLDLAGAQILIDVPSPEPVELRPKLDDIRIWIGANEPLILLGEECKSHTYQNGTVYEYLFPANLDEFRTPVDKSQVEVIAR